MWVILKETRERERERKCMHACPSPTCLCAPARAKRTDNGSFMIEIIPGNEAVKVYTLPSLLIQGNAACAWLAGWLSRPIG